MKDVVVRGRAGSGWGGRVGGTWSIGRGGGGGRRRVERAGGTRRVRRAVLGRSIRHAGM
jgi:hypothetical protein